MPEMTADLAAEYPTPWVFDGDQVIAANGARVWDVADANDNPRLAAWLVALVNAQTGKT